jgi:hypothetical protein
MRQAEENNIQEWVGRGGYSYNYSYTSIRASGCTADLAEPGRQGKCDIQVHSEEND